MSKLIVMCGIPASGKTTYAKAHMKDNDIYISRDEIRFSMVAEDEPYFSKEKEVFAEFARQINAALAQNQGDVWADATHINPISRKKLLRNITTNRDSTNAIAITTPYEQAIKFNENREGTREYVPKGEIKRMAEQFQWPVLAEGFDDITLVRWRDKDE